MPQGDRSVYTSEQKRQTRHIEKDYDKKSVFRDEAEARAWVTVNKTSGGGKKFGLGSRKKA